MIDILDFIFKNQITNESWEDIQTGVSAIISDHDKLIRYMAQYVLDGKAGGGDERRNLLGVYYDEVQDYVTWVVRTADDVWAGKWGNGDARIQKFLDAGFSMADYEMVQARVKATVDEHTNITISAPLKYKVVGGKDYVYESVPSWRGNTTMYGFAQHSYPQSPWKFNHNGCGFLSFWSVIKTIKGYTNTTPAQYADKAVKAAGGTQFPISSMVGLNMLDAEGIGYKWVKRYSTTEQLVKIVEEHLRKGKPVIISLYKNNRAGKEDKRYTNYAHYATLTHMHSDGKRAWLNDSGGKNPRFVDLWDICDHCPQANEKTYIGDEGLWNGFQNCGGVILINP
jgi:hypothetical protein